MRKLNIFLLCTLSGLLVFNVIALIGALSTDQPVTHTVIGIAVIVAVLVLTKLPLEVLRTRRFAKALAAHPAPWLVERGCESFVWKVVGQTYEDAFAVCCLKTIYSIDTEEHDAKRKPIKLPLAFLKDQFEIVDDPRVFKHHEHA